MTGFIDEMHLAAEIAQAVGRDEIMPIFQSENLGTSTKADASPVTLADKAAESALHRRLLQARPDYGWLSEEAEDNEKRLTEKYVWIVDPIDGTRSFIRRSDEFAISIGLVERNAEGVYQPVIGVVHMPAQEKTICAARRAGIFLNGKQVQPRPMRSLEDSIVTFGHGEQNAADIGSIFGSRLAHQHVVASIAMRLGQVGVGESNISVTTHKLCEWDIAAGDLICREAGMTITDLSGQPIFYNRPDPTTEGLIVCPSAHHSHVIEMCRDAGFTGEARGVRAWHH